MPKPRAGETRGNYVSRCIAHIRGKEKSKAPTREVAGKCFGMYDYYKKKGGK